MRESTLVRKLLKELNTMPGCKAVKPPHGGRAGEPDIYGCYRGEAFVLEVKVAGRSLRRLQSIRLAEWREAGAVAMRVGEEFSVREFLEEVWNELECERDTVVVGREYTALPWGGELGSPLPGKRRKETTDDAE